jgi:ABC-type molybdate transport system substrate-binding protein
VIPFGLKHAVVSSFAAVAAMISSLAHAEDAVRLYAAGSLRPAMLKIGDAFARDTGTKVIGTFGASGLLRERIEKGEPADVFASADVGHPTTLMTAGRAGPVVVFARNRLCALVRGGLDVNSDTLLDRLLDPAVKLGTSTPKADPSGDYAWVLFHKAGALRPGSFAKLEGKALQLVGRPDTPAPPPGRSLYAEFLQTGRADIFLTYCTNAREAAQEVASLRIVTIPDALAVGADYGLAVLSRAPAAGHRFALYVLSPAGQQVLADHGFMPVTLPAASP